VTRVTGKNPMFKGRYNMWYSTVGLIVSCDIAHASFRRRSSPPITWHLQIWPLLVNHMQ